MANCFSDCKVGGTEWHISVVPKRFGWTENCKSVKPSLHREKHLSPQITRHVGSHKDLQWISWRICKELSAENAEQKTKRKEKKLKDLDEVFLFKKREKINMHETNAITQRKNTRELHLELGGDIVTWVYWLRSQVGTLAHRSYSSFKLKMGLPSFV